MKNYFKFKPAIQEMSFKNIFFYFYVWKPFYSVEQKRLDNFGREPYQF